MVYPVPGNEFKIKSYKHAGKLHRVWDSNLILQRTNDRVISGNDRTEVWESDGEVWQTKEPAICCFYTEYWFNVIGMIRANGIHYYCNIASPYIYEHNAIKYIDYDLDVRVYPDLTYELLDEDEFVIHKRSMNYPHKLETILWRHIDYLTSWIHQRKGPFAPNFIDEWYERFLLYRSF